MIKQNLNYEQKKTSVFVWVLHIDVNDTRHFSSGLVLCKAGNKALTTSKFNTVIFTASFSHISKQLSKCKGQMGRSPSISIKQCKWETSLWLFKQNSSKTSACFQAEICNISLV